MSEIKLRTVTLYKEYFSDCFKKQKPKVKEKILWTFRIIETLHQIPTDYLKHLEGTDGLYEIRVQQGSDIYAFFASLTKENSLFWQTDFIKRHRRLQNLKLKKH